MSKKNILNFISNYTLIILYFTFVSFDYTDLHFLCILICACIIFMAELLFWWFWWFLRSLFAEVVAWHKHDFWWWYCHCVFYVCFLYFLFLLFIAVPGFLLHLVYPIRAAPIQLLFLNTKPLTHDNFKKYLLIKIITFKLI